MKANVTQKATGRACIRNMKIKAAHRDNLKQKEIKRVYKAFKSIKLKQSHS